MDDASNDLLGRLPASWDVADPATWCLVSEVAVVVPSVLRDPDDPVVARREVVTGAHETGMIGDPALLLGLPPRLAAIGYRAAGGTDLIEE